MLAKNLPLWPCHLDDPHSPLCWISFQAGNRSLAGSLSILQPFLEAHLAFVKWIFSIRQTLFQEIEKTLRGWFRETLYGVTLF